ncbi:aminotransferase class V-fold PLP-dependent enzyme [Herbidospora sp. NBRC 101105]|uniref:aminotransferase class V-fold PLP-dependent enzyme n=1 Tax=Herbidospora sp. NBRC 101105 TaxID=3032195 RepID=UPI0024A1809F|nr:aminotransferase class V-fold PLP-dependent enzyme [Herbidospora sp. NBRC 101105]GLX99584.1 pyoverdine biosynthesis protein PvdN [Herbidospora sp. NBRC 101105]
MTDPVETIPRRSLLLGAALAGGGLLTGACSNANAGAGASGGAPAPASATFDPRDWTSVRAQFPLTPNLAHFSAFMLSSHPAPVTAAITKFRQGLDVNPIEFGMGMADFEFSSQARQALAKYIGTQPNEIALTDSATMGIGLLYGGLALKEGDEILTTSHEFYSTYEAVRLRATATGAKVRTIRLYDDPAQAKADQMVARVKAAITSKTRVLAMTWVHSITGVKIPVKQIAALLATVNANRREPDRVLLCVDGVHGFAAEAATMKDLGADFFVTSTHKWLFGPRGTGFVWGTPAAWRRHRQIIPSFSMPAFQGWFTGQPPGGAPGDLATPGGYHTFEHRWALPAAVEFHTAIGPARVAEQIRTQSEQLKAGLAGLRHVRLVTPRSAEVSAGVICCAVEGMHPEAVVERLVKEHQVAAAATPYRETYVRFGPSMVTTSQEVDKAVRAMAALA